MSLLTSFFIGIITAYLQFTGAMADIISTHLPSDEIDRFFSETYVSGDPEFTDLSSAYDAIPKILIENSHYQSANVIDGLTVTDTYTTDPLEALVNVYCQYRRDDMIRAITGTGFIISNDGVVMTNAHVAQFLLLGNIAGEATCTIRTGNPATAAYEADLLYIPPAWIIEHASLIDAAAPQGTGERDYALLYITRGLENKPLPGRFPALATDPALLSTDSLKETTIIAGYPAETAFANGNINAKLTPQQATSSIGELLTFGSNYADVLALTGSTLGEQGASGGPVLNESGEVIGVISTRGDDRQFGAGSLRAITLSYIDRTMQEETSVSLEQMLNGDLPLRARIFKEAVVPVLQTLLRQEL